MLAAGQQQGPLPLPLRLQPLAPALGGLHAAIMLQLWLPGTITVLFNSSLRPSASLR